MDFRLKLLCLIAGNEENELAKKIMCLMDLEESIDALDCRASDLMVFSSSLRKRASRAADKGASNVIPFRPR